MEPSEFFSFAVFALLFLTGACDSSAQNCEPLHPDCKLWPAYPITREEFLAMNGSEPAGWKATFEENEQSNSPYSRAAAVNALLELKALVVEDPWGFTSGWLTHRHPCDFPSVICNRHAMVTGVDLGGPAHSSPRSGRTETPDLPRLRLARLPEGGSWDKLGRMSLQTLRFDNARLDVPHLPETWNAYPDLREVSLSGCGLSGSLPASWGSLSRLQRVDLSENPLSGPLPPEWGQLAGLRSLDLSLRARRPGAGLSGELPREWEALEKLRILDLWNQGVSGALPASWARMPALEVITLAGSQVSGSLPHEWANMTNLTTLHLADTAVSGKLPASWGSMRNLTWVDLRGTQVAPGLPSSWRTKFCKSGDGVRAPAFAYLPWKGVTEVNGVRHGESNRCTVPRRRKRRKLALGLVVLVGMVLWLAQNLYSWFRRTATSRHIKLK